MIYRGSKVQAQEQFNAISGKQISHLFHLLQILFRNQPSGSSPYIYIIYDDTVDSHTGNQTAVILRPVKDS